MTELRKGELTETSFEQLAKDGVPEAVRAKLKPLQGQTFNQKQLSDALAPLLSDEEKTRYTDPVLKSGKLDDLHSLGTDIPTLVALLVCLIPTTIGALLAAIGIAGMDRALRANIIAKSGKAVEVAGDVDTLLLDKTGTITIGNRRATQFLPLGEASAAEVGQLAALASAADQTPEGKSIVELFRRIPAASRSRPSPRRRLASSSSRPRRA